jgi:hypothetical protein
MYLVSLAIWFDAPEFIIIQYSQYHKITYQKTCSENHYSRIRRPASGEDVGLSEDVLVTCYPYGDIFGNTIKVIKEIVSANHCMGNAFGQF